MTTRAVSPGKGWNWLVRAVNLGSHKAGAIFGGAALMLLVSLALGFGLALVMGGVQMALKPGAAGGMLISFLIMLPLMAIICAFMVGYMRLLDAVEGGRPASATDVFAGFRDRGASGRVLGFVVVLAIVQYAVMGALIALLAPEFGKWYLEAMQASAAGGTPPDPSSMPSGFGAMFVSIMLVTLFFYAVQAIGVGQIALRGRGIGGALGDGVAGTAKNLLPLLVLLLVGIGVGILATLAVFLVAMVIGLIGKAVGMWLAMLLAIPLYLAALLVVYVVMFGIMYFMWRDVCGDGADAAPVRNDQLEV